uniref:Uncharacterized protein n=1 Tax=Anguilla anguilla TaxID=7936 RepID=A0A0E9R431_ANGAN
MSLGLLNHSKLNLQIWEQVLKISCYTGHKFSTVLLRRGNAYIPM